MEQWNAYTKAGELTETVLVRGTPIPQGLYHLVCEVLVQHVDGSFLCMKRHHSKQDYPGYFEVTAGGSALLGETPFQCIRRELYEETGISCEDYEEIAYHVFDDSQCLFYSFLCVIDWDKENVKLQPGETEGYKWLTEKQFIDFIHSGQMIDTQKKRYKNYFLEKGYL